MAYKKWRLSELSLVLVEAMTEGTVVTVEFTTPNGTISIIGEPHEVETTLVVKGAHIESSGIKPNVIGIVNLRAMAALIMEDFGYDRILVEGETGTTGANPSRRPRPMRFTRDRHVEDRS